MKTKINVNQHGSSDVKYFSRFGFYTVFIFCINSLIGRFLFPLADEPDYRVRVRDLFDVEYHSLWSPYYIFNGLIHRLDIRGNINCEVDSSPLSIWARIDQSTCTDDIENIIIRFTLLIMITLPLLTILIFRKLLVCYYLGISNRISSLEWDRKLDIIGLSLTFPAMVYYLGLLSVEQFSLFVSLFIFIFWDYWFIIILILSIIASIDPGNAIVVTFFVLVGKATVFMGNFMKLKSVFMGLFMGVSFSYVVGFVFLEHLRQFHISHDRIDALYMSMSTSELLDKYPIILRPGITYMNFIFSTPTSIKVVPAYLFFSFALLLLLIRLKKFYKQMSRSSSKKYYFLLKKDVILALSGLSTIFIFVFLFPTYANAKYYIFILPFFISVAIRVYRKTMVFLFSILLSTMIFVNLILYQI